MNKRALGRGLSTLLPSRSKPLTDDTVPAEPAGEITVRELRLEQIKPNPFQPRRHFDEGALNELAQSIRVDGVIQPLVVRQSADGYQLIAGERRLRASKIAGLATVPVHIQEMADDRMLEVALVENIQREDLNPMEASRAFFSLSEELGLSHEEIGQRTGKDRATISNAIRLLQLPEDVQQMLSDRKLTPGHGRALLKLSSPEKISSIANEIVTRELSVRAVEQLTSETAAPSRKTSKDTPGFAQDANVRAAIDDMQEALETKVRIITKTGGKGRIEIDFFSAEELERIYNAIMSLAR